MRMTPDRFEARPELEDLLLDAQGAPITTAAQWQAQRARLAALIEDCMLGHAPQDGAVAGETLCSEEAFGGKALREVLRVRYGPGLAYAFDVAVLRPNTAGPCAVITWNQFGTASEFCVPCPVEEEAVARGYAIAVFDREQLVPDHPGEPGAVREAYPACDGGAIRLWGWAHSKLADYLVTLPWVDATRLIATGHSRGGKAALAACAYDARFALCAPINSGCAGAGCFRFLGDAEGLCQDPVRVECLGRIAQVFPYWWNDSFPTFGGDVPPHWPGHEAHLPFDLHALKALVAPRALLSCEGLDDAWANPYGTFLTWRAAQPVFALLGAPDSNAVFYRPGQHAFSRIDWLTLLSFCDRVLYGRAVAPTWNNAPF